MWEIQARCISHSKRVAATAVGIIQLSPFQIWELLTLPGEPSASFRCCVVAVWPSCSHEGDQALAEHAPRPGHDKLINFFVKMIVHVRLLHP